MFKNIITDWYAIKAVMSEDKHIFLNLKDNKNIVLLINMLIVGEDHRFLYHFGFDLIAIIRATRNNIFYNKREGASTIEQQLVRTITKNFEKSFKRKIKEIILASFLSFKFSKKRIAFTYLNRAYYGTDLETLKKILTIFNCSLQNVEHINMDVCAGIVARLKYPEPKENKINRSYIVKKISIRKQHILNLYTKRLNNKIFNWFYKYE